MLKRICAFFLILMMAISLAVVTPVFAASQSDVQLLSDLGIIDLTRQSGLIPKPFNRGEFARSLCVMATKEPGLGISNENADVYASDIANNENYNAIAMVLAMGYMETDIDGKFNPGHALTERDAIYALINILGYKPWVQYEGGTEADYYAMAQKLNLFKGVKISDSEKLTAAETAELLANAMGVKIYTTGSINLGGICLWEYWELTKHTGRILANSNLGLMVDKTSYRRVNIDGNTYYTELLIPDEYVGCDVTYYTSTLDGDTEIVSVYVDNYDGRVTLEADDIVNVKEHGSSIEIIYNNNDKLKLQKTGFVIVNGKTQSPTKKLFDAFKNGTVTFIDSDNDGTIDLAHMTLLVQNIIEGVYVDLQTMTTRYNNHRIDLSNVDRYEIYLGKNTAELSELTAGMVVGVACDAFTIANDNSIVYNYNDANLIKLYVSTRNASGFVDMLTKDAIIVEDMEYNYGTAYDDFISKGYISDIELGDYVKLYLDSFGNIVYYEADMAKSSLAYGYIIAAGSDTKGIDKKTIVKILDTNGTFNLLESNDKFILDGQKVSSGNTSYTIGSVTVDLSKRQLVRFRAADGVLKEIDTAKVVESENSLTEDLKFDPYVTGYSAYKIRSGAINRQFAFQDDCIMFLDGADLNENNPPEIMFSVGKFSSARGSYNMAGYDADDGNHLGCVVSWETYGMADGDAITSPINYHELNGHVVEKVIRAMDDEGNLGWYINLAGDNAQGEYFISEDNLKLYTTQSASDWGNGYLKIYKRNNEDLMSVIKSGDIIRFETNVLGNINYIEKMFDFESHKDTTTPIPSGTHVYGFANVEKISGDYFIYSYDGNDTNYIAKKRSVYSLVPLYHVKTGDVEMVEMSQLPSRSTGNTVKVFIRDYDGGTAYDHVFYIYD